MESRNFSLIFLGPPTSGKSSFTTLVAETLHLPILHGSQIVDPDLIPTDGSLVGDTIFNESLRRHLQEEPPTGHIFDGIPRTPAQAKVISEWSQEQGFPIHVFDLEVSDEEVLDRIQNREVCPTCQESYHFKVKPSRNPNQCDIDGTVLTRRRDDNLDVIQTRLQTYQLERDEILNILNSDGAIIHHINSNSTIRETSRNIFKELSPFTFEDPNLAKRYFDLIDVCASNNIDLMLISGACSYIYRGRRPLKDLDILVPDLGALTRIAATERLVIEPIESSYATSQYLNYSGGVELVTDLTINYSIDSKVKRVPFNFSDLEKDSKTVRFLGESCKIMSPEWLLVFKLCMGRSGTDDFGHNKNDYADAYDVTVSQPIDYQVVDKIAQEIGASERVKQGLVILRSSAY